MVIGYRSRVSVCWYANDVMTLCSRPNSRLIYYLLFLWNNYYFFCCRSYLISLLGSMHVTGIHFMDTFWIDYYLSRWKIFVGINSWQLSMALNYFCHFSGRFESIAAVNIIIDSWQLTMDLIHFHSVILW